MKNIPDSLTEINAKPLAVSGNILNTHTHTHTHTFPLVPPNPHLEKLQK